VPETVKKAKISFLWKSESRKALCRKGFQALGGQSGGLFYSWPGKYPRILLAEATLEL